MHNMIEILTRPPRMSYHLRRLGDSLSPYQRTDTTIFNKRGQCLALSYYEIGSLDAKSCLIYLHTNNGSRLEGHSQLNYFSRLGLNICLFDFAGCGNSEGDYVSLGLNQADDLDAVMTYLRNERGIQSIVLWGRSMGAVSALVYCSKYTSAVKCLVLDSPFRSLTELIYQQVRSHSLLSALVFPLFRSAVYRQFHERTDRSIEELNIEELMQRGRFKGINAVFVTSNEDSIVDASSVERLFHLYPSKSKRLLYTSGTHDSPRSPSVYEEIIRFVRRVPSKSKAHLLLDVSTTSSLTNEGLRKELLSMMSEEEVQKEKRSKRVCSWNCLY